MSIDQETKKQGRDNIGHDHPKEITITVNGQQKVVTKEELSFIEITALAFNPPPQGGNTIFTITYRRGHGNKEGSLVAGDTIKIKEGMIFDVTSTDRS